MLEKCNYTPCTKWSFIMVTIFKSVQRLRVRFFWTLFPLPKEYTQMLIVMSNMYQQ